METDEEEEESGASSSSGDSLFGTETMAELCVRQGRVREALSIYRSLLSGPADDQRRARWHERLVALEHPSGEAVPLQRTPATTAGSSEAPPALGLTTPGRRAPAPAAAIVALTGGGGRANDTRGGVALAARGAIHRLPKVIREPVRSGQIVYAEKNDLIVLAPVNPGAQLIADGNIHVYARLRGRAVAGAHGATDARIYCQKLEAELVGIDSAYLIADDIPPARLGLPAQVFWQDGRCLVIPL